MIQKTFYIFLLSIILSACTNQVTIDNPTPKDIELTIGSKILSIKANTVLGTQLKSGEHLTIAINSDGDTLINEVVNVSEEGLLNISETNYFLWTDLFCEEADFEKFKSNLNLKDTVKIDGLEFVDIDLEILNNKFIPKNWDYALNELRPKEIEVSDENGYKVVSKLYRLQELKEAFNYMGDVDLNNLTHEEIESFLKEKVK